MPTKGCWGFFLFSLDLELLRKMVSVNVETRYFLIFANNSKSKENNKLLGQFLKSFNSRRYH